MVSLISYAQELLKTILSPPICATCKERLEKRNLFCTTCEKKLIPAASIYLKINNHITIPVHAACIYQNPVRSLVLKKRHGNITGCYTLAELIWQKTIFNQIPCDIIIPIPLHWTRFVQRGFNQAQEIAEILAHKKNCACKNILKRVKKTEYQSELPIDQRTANVQEAFALQTAAQNYTNKHLVLLDDLMTTGSTLKSAARELIKLKPASLTILVACRAPIIPK